MKSDELLARADAFADRRHRHQFRRDGVTPYVEHPRAVMRILRDEFGIADADVLVAGLLHDTIEDTNTDYDDVRSRFGIRVASFVAFMTKDKRLPETRREREYFAQLKRAPVGAKLIKMADTLHNLRDSDDGHRAKAAGKARRLIRTFGGARGVEKPMGILKKEL